MRGSTKALLRGFVKDTFRKVGVDVRRYVPDRPNGPARGRPPGLPTNVLDMSAISGGWLPHRTAPFVLAATNHGTMIVNHNDHYALGDNPGYGMGFQLLNASCFDYEEVKLALDLLAKRRESHGPGLIAIDCGANIGVHSVEWARHMHGWGSVIAIEAQERIYYALCGNIAINNCFNARALLAAVGAKAGRMPIPVPDYSKPGSFGSLELRKHESTEYIGQEIDYAENACLMKDVIAIDDLTLPRLDFLKIDVEGMEMDVLAGAETSIGAHHPPMILEVIKSDREQIKSYLTKHGYRHYPFEGNFLAVHELDATAATISVADGKLRIDPS